VYAQALREPRRRRPVLSGASTAARQATLRLPAEQLVRSLAGRRKERQLAMEEYSCG